jgi:hypothetical protein
MDNAELGTLHKVDPGVVDDDFWSVVRRRHPDVDLVLLAPDHPDDPFLPAPGPVAPEVVRVVAAAVHAAWHTLVPLLVERGVVDLPAVRWAPRGGGHALLVTKAVRGIGQDPGADLLGDVAEVLGRRGWRLAPGRRSGHPLLRATDGIVDLEAEAGPGATVLRLATGVIAAQEQDRDAVLDEVVDRMAEEASSWR